MKRYIAFSYYDYYPGGGWNDFVGQFDDLEEAINSEPTQIVDTHTQKVVWGDGAQ